MQIACHVHEPGTRAYRNVDRLYLGERFCSVRYLQHLKHFVDAAECSDIPAWLAVPGMVHEGDFDRVVEATLDAAGSFQGVLTGDYGLARRIRGRCRLVYDGMVLNREAARRIREMLGAEQIRLHPPALETLEALAGIVPLEIVLHGRIPLSATPRCLTRSLIGCEVCNEQRTVRGGPVPLVLRGNVLYAPEPVQAFGLLPRLEELGLATGVIEATGLGVEEGAELADIYRGEKPPPNRNVSGLYFGSDKSFLLSGRWMDVTEVPDHFEGG